MAVEDLGDTDGWRAYPVDGNPFAPEAVIPEPDASIRAQHAALLDPRDPREAMLYNPGQQPIENQRLGQTRLQDGRVVQFDRQGLGALTPQKVAAYDRSNRLNELLQYGPVSKDDAIARAMAGEQPAVVTTTRNDVPVKEAAGTTATAPAQVAAQEATKGPGDTVGVNHPSSVLARQQGFTGHVAATSDPQHPLTARSLPFSGQQASVAPFQPSPTERIQQGVSEAAQSYGVPTKGAERIGQAAGLGAQATPVLGQVLSGAEAVHSAQHGDLAGTVAGLGGIVPTGASLIGPWARTWNKPIAEQAERMLAKGASADEIEHATKLFQNPVSQWQKEIPDIGAKYTEDPKARVLSDVLELPQAYDAYPSLKYIPITYYPKGQQSKYLGAYYANRQAPGSVNVPPGSMELARGQNVDVPLHETAHAIASIERWPAGGSPKTPYEANQNYGLWEKFTQKNLDTLMNNPPKNAAEYGKFMGIEDPTGADFEFQDFQNALNASRKANTVTGKLRYYATQKANHDYYRSHYGEAEARNVPYRLEQAEKLAAHNLGGYDQLPSFRKTMDTNEFSLPPYAGGGRVGFQDGGGVEGLEAVEGNPFDLQPPDRTMRKTDYDRARFRTEPLSDMHRRIAEASKDERHGFAGGGGLEAEEEELQRQREAGTASGGDLGSASPVRSPGLFGGARPVQPSAQFGTSAVTEPELAPAAPAPAPVLRHDDPAFPEGRIATRTPSAVGAADPHLSSEARIGLDTMQAHPPTYAKTANVARQMPFVKSVVETDDGPKAQWNPTGLHNIPETATPEEAHQALIAHWKSNILALHDAVPEEIRPGSMLWYDGANARATQKATTYNRPVENTAGVYAALSPQKDWFENVSLGDRVMDVMHTQQDTPFTPAMWRWARSAIKDPDDLATLRSMRPTKDSPGRTLGAINDPHGQALWVRAYDEAHNPRDYNIVNPDGTFGPTATNTNGSNSKVAWGSFDAIEKAVKAFNAPNMPAVSQAMGDRHKVRNFYNNIVAPNSEHGDVTIDTHAIAGANLIPMAGEDKDVDIGLGGSGGSTNVTGSKGLYGAYAEAYRQAAAERGVQPRQMQSITWEALRGLWSPSEKGDPATKAFVQNVWNMWQQGQISLPAAQRMLMTDPQTGASRITPPEWHTAGWRPPG